MFLHVFFSFGAGEALGVEFMARGHGLGTRERTILVDEVPTAAHDHEEPFQVRVGGRFVEREAGEIALPPVNIVQEAAGLDELVHHLPLPGGD